MIFITLGSQKFQFNRLLKAIDKLVEQGKIKEEVFAQIGYSDYQPINYNYKQFLDRDEFAAMEGKADIVITHGGTGAIIGAVKKGKKVIAVPRLAKYGEHVDDHQLQLLKEFEDSGKIRSNREYLIFVSELNLFLVFCCWENLVLTGKIGDFNYEKTCALF